MAIFSGQIEALEYVLKDSKVKVKKDTLNAIAQTVYDALDCDCAPALPGVVLLLHDAIEQR